MRRLVTLALLLGLCGQLLPAQVREGTRVGVTRPGADSMDLRAALQPSDAGPPITPGRAFLASFLFPGAGQSALDRPYAGGVFLLVEAVSLVMVHRGGEDLRLARRFARDSMPLSYQTDPVTGVVARDSLGNAIVSAWQTSPYGPGIVRSRRLQVEDWLAVLFFNHLFSGADAYVAAQLWDLPDKVAIKQTPFGPAIAATLRFGRAPRR